MTQDVYPRELSRMEIEQKKTTVGCLTAFFAVPAAPCWIYLFNYARQQASLHSQGVAITATVTTVFQTRYLVQSINYIYAVDGQTYRSQQFPGSSCFGFSPGDTLPIVYMPAHPEVSAPATSRVGPGPLVILVLIVAVVFSMTVLAGIRDLRRLVHLSTERNW